MPLSNPNVQQISASNSTYTGTVRITGGPNITVGTDASGITMSAAAGGAGGGINIAASDATYTSGTVSITGVGGGVTVNSNTGQRVDISVAAPVAQTGTQFSGGVSNIGNTSGNTKTVGGQVVLAGGNNVTLSESTNGVSATITISGPNTVAQTGTQFSAGISGGNTSGNTGTVGGQVVFAGGNNITLSGSTNGVSETITISAPNAPAAQTGISSIAVSNTTYTSGMVVFTGSNMITAKSSGAGQTVIFDATQSVQTQNVVDVSVSGNSTTGGAGAALISSGTMTLAGGPNITISQAGNAVSISGPAAGGGATISGLMPFAGSYTLANMGQNTLGLVPFVVPQQLNMDRALNYVRVSLSSSSNSSHAMAVDLRVGIFTANASTLSLSVSGSAVHSWSNTSNNSFPQVTGLRIMTVPISASLTPGVYFLGVLSSTRTTNTNWGTASQLLITQSGYSLLGGIGQHSSIASIQFVPGLGIGTVTTGAMPGSVAFSDIEGFGGAVERYAKIPVVNFTSGTV